ncbi:MAG: hypothetical protein ACHREM_13685 [Polyangiales bacterium]
MHRFRKVTAPLLVAFVANACSSSTSDPVVADSAISDAAISDTAISDAAISDSATSDPAFDAAADSGAATIEVGEGGDVDAGATCSVSGVAGTCMTVTACAALGTYTSTPGLCPGAADIQCCAETPSVASNPPTPTGHVLMAQSEVTADMTTWAVAILHDPITYPMFSTTTKTFGTQLVLARVEWHPPDFLNSAVHRGVTLYKPS